MVKVFEFQSRLEELISECEKVVGVKVGGVVLEEDEGVMKVLEKVAVACAELSKGLREGVVKMKANQLVMNEKYHNLLMANRRLEEWQMEGVKYLKDAVKMRNKQGRKGKGGGTIDIIEMEGVAMVTALEHLLNMAKDIVDVSSVLDILHDKGKSYFVKVQEAGGVLEVVMDGAMAAMQDELEKRNPEGVEAVTGKVCEFQRELKKYIDQVQRMWEEEEEMPYWKPAAEVSQRSREAHLLVCSQVKVPKVFQMRNKLTKLISECQATLGIDANAIVLVDGDNIEEKLLQASTQFVREFEKAVIKMKADIEEENGKTCRILKLNECLYRWQGECTIYLDGLDGKGEKNKEKRGEEMLKRLENLVDNSKDILGTCSINSILHDKSKAACCKLKEVKEEVGKFLGKANDDVKAAINGRKQQNLECDIVSEKIGVWQAELTKYVAERGAVNWKEEVEVEDPLEKAYLEQAFSKQSTQTQLSF